MPASTADKSKHPSRLGILPSAVSFLGTAYDMRADSYEMSGSMAVAMSIISLSYLWNEIRVQGGAYGASMGAGRTGNISCLTFRDPTPARSIAKLRLVPDFLADYMKKDDVSIDGAIISSIGNADPLLSPSSKGKAEDEFYYSNYSYAETESKY